MVVRNIHSEELIKYILYVLNFTAVLLPNYFKVLFHGVFVFASPRPFAWPPALAPVPKAVPQFVVNDPGLEFIFTGPGLKFVFSGPGRKFVFTGPGL